MGTQLIAKVRYFDRTSLLLLVGVIPASVERQDLLKCGDGVPLVIALDLAANHYNPGGVVDRYLCPAVQVKDRVVGVVADLGDKDRGAFEVTLQLDCIHGESPFKGCLPSGVRPLQDSP